MRLYGVCAGILALFLKKGKKNSVGRLQHSLIMYSVHYMQISTRLHVNKNTLYNDLV